MIPRAQMQRLAASYGEPRVGVMGSHSALEIMDGAKDEGLQTAVYCQRGRDAPYRRFSRVADEVVTLARFADMASARVQRSMRESSTIVVPHRSFAVYLGYARIENSFRVPLFGNRAMLRAEERDEAKNQYDLLRKAGIRHPRVVRPEEIDGPCIVKVQEGRRRLERAFFTVSSREDYEAKSRERIRSGTITRAGLRRAAIEELAIGTYMNFNFFSTPLTPEAEFLGVERRLQSNIHDYNALPARQQLDMDIDIQNVEVGHTPASVRESLLERVFGIGDRFVRAARSMYRPGVIGPFSLQSVITKDLELVVYDVSMRVPGNPILATTSPYTKYTHGRTIGVGRRIAMEIARARDAGRLADVVT
ncbi:MAG: DUF1297 domain-containing protein [Thaumarchaeota archaeon S15]|nr:MAG: DUF1297 domain-containing protein [Thaumarchaeota archaeon S13]RNJ75407.1 MAG: DUF1297 domain-containing protein [Thaumarchaeota archaeon S15]